MLVARLRPKMAPARERLGLTWEDALPAFALDEQLHPMASIADFTLRSLMIAATTKGTTLQTFPL